jgi:glutathione S-transferase
MGPVVHHLRVSQPERIVWLFEELNVPYTLHKYDRNPLAAPEAIKNIPGNTLGIAPVFQDGDVTLRV